MEYFLQILEASFPLPVVHFAAGLLTGIALYHWLGPEASRLRLDRLRLQCEREDRANAERKEAAQRRLANCKKRQEEAQKQEEQRKRQEFAHELIIRGIRFENGQPLDKHGLRYCDECMKAGVISRLWDDPKEGFCICELCAKIFPPEYN